MKKHILLISIILLSILCLSCLTLSWFLRAPIIKLVTNSNKNAAVVNISQDSLKSFDLKTTMIEQTLVLHSDNIEVTLNENDFIKTIIYKNPKFADFLEFDLGPDGLLIQGEISKYAKYANLSNGLLSYQDLTNVYVNTQIKYNSSKKEFELSKIVIGNGALDNLIPSEYKSLMQQIIQELNSTYTKDLLTCQFSLDEIHLSYPKTNFSTSEAAPVLAINSEIVFTPTAKNIVSQTSKSVKFRISESEWTSVLKGMLPAGSAIEFQTQQVIIYLNVCGTNPNKADSLLFLQPKDTQAAPCLAKITSNFTDRHLAISAVDFGNNWLNTYHKSPIYAQATTFFNAGLDGMYSAGKITDVQFVKDYLLIEMSL
jgi:hypothetical protein